MKLTLKMIAAAAAMASLAGGAKADITSGSTVENGSMVLVAWNTQTQSWYIRDLGYFINDFLPTGITTNRADNRPNSQGFAVPAAGASGDKTPNTGLMIDKTVKANFGDASFSAWFNAQGDNRFADVNWLVGAYDQVSASSSGSQRRAIVASPSMTENFTNANLDTFVGTSSFGGLAGLANSFDLSKSGVGYNASFNNFSINSGIQASNKIDQTSYLYYAVRSTFTGSSLTSAVVTPFANETGLATITLEADGDLFYSVTPVPLPGALWMMGAGLVAVGAMARRRSAAAAAADRA